jgi:hypothetical protein
MHTGVNIFEYRIDGENTLDLPCPILSTFETLGGASPDGKTVAELPSKV